MGHRIRCGIILVCVLLLALPRPPVHASANETMMLAERVAALEEFRQQQRDWNTSMDRRVSTDLSASQGVQDARTTVVEEKLNTITTRQMVVNSFGALGSLILIVGAPIVWSAYVKKHNQLVRSQKRLERLYRIAGYEVPDDDEEPD